MAPLAPIEVFETYKQTDVSQHGAAVFALDAASAFIRGYTGQDFDYVEDDEVSLWPRWHIVALPQLPVIEVASVLADGDPVDYTLRPSGLLELTGTWSAPVVVTYTHGYTTIPADVVMACCVEAGLIYDAPSRSGVRAESIDDYSVTYADATEASGVLSTATKAMLAPYKLKALV